MNATEDGEPLGEAPELPPAQYDPEVAEYLAWLCKWPETPVGYSLTEPGHIEKVPVLGENERNAIAEIRHLHRRVHPVFNWSSGLRLDEPCPECDGKAGVHECGCWADEDMEYSCATCRDDKGRHTSYPCATTEALDKWGVQ